MSEPLKILLVEDDKVDAIHTRKLLEQGFGENISLDWEHDWDSGSQAVDRKAHSLYLIDYRLGPRDGLDLVRHAVEHGCSAPIILLTGMDSDEIDIQAMEAGATDYLCKDNLSAMLLKKSIRYALARQQFHKSLIDARDLLAQKNQKLSELYETAHQFVDNVSHEFRTPLTVIKEYAAIIQEGLVGGINEEQKDFLGIILSRVDDLGLMVNDMLDTSRLEAGLLGMKREEHHIEEIIDHIKPVLLRRAMGNAVSLSINLDPDLPKVYCDAEKIGRVIVNLGVNAIKFSGENGSVSLWASYDRDASQIVVGITDDGPGIAPENVEIIFGRFKQVGGDVRARTQGFGLGLNIANELVQLNFGEILLESEIDKGSTFSFSIPTLDPPRIVDRWLARTDRLQDGASTASLIALRHAPAKTAALMEETSVFIQETVLHRDLILNTAANSWLLLTVLPKEDLGELAKRVKQARLETNRNRIGDELPDLSLELIGTWQLANERDALIANAMAQFDSTERNPSTPQVRCLSAAS